MGLGHHLAHDLRGKDRSKLDILPGRVGSAAKIKIKPLLSVWPRCRPACSVVGSAFQTPSRYNRLVVHPSESRHCPTIQNEVPGPAASAARGSCWKCWTPGCPSALLTQALPCKVIPKWFLCKSFRQALFWRKSKNKEKIFLNDQELLEHFPEWLTTSLCLYLKCSSGKESHSYQKATGLTQEAALVPHLCYSVFHGICFPL